VKGKSRAGGLTLLILAVNIVPVLVLIVGLLSLGQYRQNLINENIKLLRERTQNLATAVGEGAVRPMQQGRPFLFAKPEEIEVMVPELARRMVRRLAENESIHESRIRLFDRDGTLVADSHQLTGPGGIVNIVPLEPPPEQPLSFSGMLAYAGTQMLTMLPIKNDLPRYRETAETSAFAYADAALAMSGQVSGRAWQDRNSQVFLTAAAPVRKMDQVLGVILLSSGGRDIEEGMARVRYDVLTAALAALSLTFFLSLYLAGAIGTPLKKLALAAEAVRQHKGRQLSIPDFSRRKDEIGELSLSLRAMTQALWDRMDTIERFAADVAHEIKNPLTSLRSAVETAARIRNPEDRDRLMEIIQHDVQRLDRLISDISNASRLDAELSREEMTVSVDLSALLRQLADSRRGPLARAGTEGEAPDGEPHIVLDLPEGAGLHVRGSESRLAQVFENLIGNALSFSPPGGTVLVRARKSGNGAIETVVTDQGPGIPENKLETIFERFYSERPKHEDYGSHSGLGLSIARQIVTAHGGFIAADNIRDETGAVTGARFTVILNGAA
jgi:two-component system sensor histidine kinase ChvG